MLQLIKLPVSRSWGFFIEIISIATSKQRLVELFRIPLYLNAFYLMMSSILAALFGFAFWIIAARIYPDKDVGLASAVIAAMSLISGFANLGLGYGLIRYLPRSGEKANSLLNSSFTISILASLIASLIFLGGLGLWSPALIFLRQDPLFFAAFVVFTVASTLKFTAGEALIAERRSGFILAREVIVQILRIPLLIGLAIVFKSFGIFGSWGISLWVALLFNILLFLPRVRIGYRPRLTIGREINEMLHFSFGNYISSLFWVAPGLILSIMIVNILGSDFTAYFYVTWMAAGTLGMIAETTALSLFVEGSHDEQMLETNVLRTLKLTFLIMLPAVIIILVFADKLLLAFGGSYSESATTLFRILAIATLPSVITVVYLGAKRVDKKLKILIAVPAFIATTTILLSYILLPGMGITGAGVSWLISQGIVALVIIVSIAKKRANIKKA